MPPADESPATDADARAPGAPVVRAHAWRVPGSARWASTLGALGALLLLVAPFLPWLTIEPSEAERFGLALAEAAAKEPAGAGSEGFAALGRSLAERHELTGLDLVQWSREARARLSAERSASAAAPDERARLLRGWTVVALVVLGMGGLALLLAAYLLWHRLARFRPPVQVLAGALAGVSLALAGGLTWLLRSFGATASVGSGHTALLVGGAASLVALVGTVRVIHLLGVLLVTALTLLALGALAWAYVAGGLAA